MNRVYITISYQFFLNNYKVVSDFMLSGITFHNCGRLWDIPNFTVFQVESSSTSREIINVLSWNENTIHDRRRQAILKFIYFTCEKFKFFWWIIFRLLFFVKIKLKELRNYSRKLLLSATKISGNTTNILNCYFSKQIYTLAHQTKYLHM